MPESAASANKVSSRSVPAGVRARNGRVRGSDRKAQITRETLRLVAEHGIQGTSMSRISAAVGVSSAALYRHFDSRDDILIAAFDTLMERFTHWLKDSEVPTALDRLRDMCERHASLFSQDIEGWNAPMFQFTVYIPKDRVREHVRVERAKMFEAVGEIIEEGKVQGCVDPDVDVKLAVADLYAWIYWEDLSFLEGLDHEYTQRNSEDMYCRILKRLAGSRASDGGKSPK